MTRLDCGPASTTYEPLGVLKPVGDRLWIVDGPEVTLTVMGVDVSFPTRMTVAQMNDGGLWCHSPIALDDALRERMNALGPVRHLVSPNKLHYLGIPEWQRSWPEAIAWASPGVRERARDHGIEVRFDADLGDQPPADWAGQIDQLVFRGSRFMEEVVFFHAPSATVMLADLIENFEPERLARRWRWLVGLAGATDPDGKAPVDLRMTFWGHKAQAAECLERMLAWKPERVVLAHGRWYDHDGSAELRRAFRWLL
jgi:hypothetical protein